MSTNETPNSLWRSARLLSAAGNSVTGEPFPIRRPDREFFTVSLTLTTGTATLEGRVGDGPWYPLTPEGQETAVLSANGIYIYRKVPGNVRGVTSGDATGVTMLGDA